MFRKIFIGLSLLLVSGSLHANFQTIKYVPNTPSGSAYSYGDAEKNSATSFFTALPPAARLSITPTWSTTDRISASAEFGPLTDLVSCVRPNGGGGTRCAGSEWRVNIPITPNCVYDILFKTSIGLNGTARLYVWNRTAGTYQQKSTITGTAIGTRVSMNWTATSDMSDYVSPNGDVYYLVETTTRVAMNVFYTGVTVSYYVSPAVPTINPVNTPTNNKTQIITGTMSPGTVTINVLCNTATAGTVMYPTTTSWQVTISAMSIGNNPISINAQNPAGISNYATVNITVYVMPTSINNITQATYYTTVGEALASANAGDIIELATGNYLENLTWPNKTNIWLRGKSGISSTNVVLNAQGVSHSIHINHPIAVSLSNLTIRGGTNPATGAGDVLYGGALSVSNNIAILNLENVILSGNSATTGTTDAYRCGGAIYFNGYALNINNCRIINNQATYQGGAIFLSRGAISVTNCIISGNTAINNGGGALYCNFDNTILQEIENTWFTGNSAGGDAGATYFSDNFSYRDVRNCTFNYNSALGNGGTAMLGDHINYYDCSFIGNRANGLGGVFYDVITDLTDCTLSGNYAGTDGGVAAVRDTYSGIALTMNVTNCEFINNRTAGAAGNNGGVYYQPLNTTVQKIIFRNSTFTGNRAGDGGVVCNGLASFDDCSFNANTAINGGILSQVVYTMEDCLVSGNTGSGNGGALYATGTIGPSTITKSTFRNQQANQGGVFSGGQITLDRVWLENNRATTRGGISNQTSLSINNTIIVSNNGGTQGGVFWTDTTLTLTNCTIVSNSATSGAVIFRSAGTPIIKNSIIVGGTTFFNDTTPVVTYTRLPATYTGIGNITTNPSFVNQSARDFRLNSGSPCLDTATNNGVLNYDYDNMYRPQGARSDMGAYEKMFFLIDENNPTRFTANAAPSNIFSFRLRNVAYPSSNISTTVNINGLLFHGTGLNRFDNSHSTVSTDLTISINYTLAFNTTYNVTINSASTGNSVTDIYWFKTMQNTSINNITQGLYYSTIQSAVSNANPGNIIELVTGSYLENVTWVHTNGITIRGKAGISSANIIINGNRIGHAIYIGYPVSVSLQNLTIANAQNPGAAANSSYGGGICVYQNNAILNLKNVIISGNICTNNTTVYNRGGGIYFYGNKLNLDTCILKNNTAGYAGGGLYLDNGEVSVINSQLIGNKALVDNAGAIYFSPGIVFSNLSGGVFTNNSAQNSGGAIAGGGTNVSYTSCRFSGNTAINGGVFSGGIVSIQRSLFHDNRATTRGGIFDSAIVSAINCIGVSNNGGTQGGVIWANNTTQLVNCTFVSNNATNGQFLYRSSGSPEITNTIVWGSNAPFSDTASTVIYSDIQGTHPGVGNSNSAPLFVDQNTWDFHLQSGSPCIDSGTNSGAPSVDYDGDQRPSGLSADIGAFELLSAPSVSITRNYQVFPPADYIAKGGVSANAVPGSLIVFNNTFKNFGTGTATDVVIVDSLPEFTTYVTGSVDCSVPANIQFQHSTSDPVFDSNETLPVTALRWQLTSPLGPNQSGIITYNVTIE
jgi:uncharacterized repeat protein (TIGR01451 family)